MSIESTLKILNELTERGIISDYALCGAVAAARYIEPVSTYDIDVFVELPSSSKVITDPTPIFAFLRERGYQMEGEHVVIDGWPVQFLAPPGELGDDALESARTLDVDGISISVLRAEHLAALALQTGRPKDHMRLAELVKSSDFDNEVFESIVDRFGLREEWRRFNAK